MPSAIVDGTPVEFEAGLNVLQVCELAGVEIPRFCYHDRLSVAGNCRMCLVQLEDGRGLAPKPAASCATPCSDGLIIHTQNATVRKARAGVMEFLLINHPLDCPICDQGGECDLQDQAMAYGAGGSRFHENKRAVADKYMGPLVKTVMTRCIQCTRCVRFATEVAGVDALGLLNRGEQAEISTLEQAVHSELSGNLVDICPVGALTSKPYAFNARPWELRKTPSVDVMDAVGSNIRIDARGRDILRVLPRLHEDVNEEWLADKSRYAIDGLTRQRLDQPFVRDAAGRLQPASWDEAFTRIADKLATTAPSAVAAIAGDLCAAEEMFALKALMDSLGVTSIDCRQDGAYADAGNRASYLFNSTIEGIEEADTLLLVGTNPRIEAPLINARLRKRYLRGGARFIGLGEPVDLSYEVNWVGENLTPLASLFAPSGPLYANSKDKAGPHRKSALIIGQQALRRPDAPAILARLAQLAEENGILGNDWNGFNVLQTAAARIAGLDMGFVPGEQGRDVAGILEGAENGQVEFVYLLAADEIDHSQLEKSFVVYQGHHGDAGAHVADVILPGAAYTEKNGTYVNTEGRVQLGRLAVLPPGDAREDWTILRALSQVLGHPLPFDNLSELRAAMVEAVPHFGQIDQISPAPWQGIAPTRGGKGEISDAPLGQRFAGYHMTCPISRASATMAACVAELGTGRAWPQAAE